MIAQGTFSARSPSSGCSMPCCGGQAFPYLRREVPDRRNISSWPEPPNKVTNIADAAGRVQAGGQVKGLPSHVARLLRLPLRSVGGGKQ